MGSSTNLYKNAVEGKLKFVDHHLPTLEAGKYEVRVKQTIQSPGGGEAEESLVAEKLIAVAGPQFAIPERHIHAHYPPKNGNADYDGVVPSISFNRITLPWERSPDRSATTSDGASWMALLLVDSSDFQEGRIKEVYKEEKTMQPYLLKELNEKEGYFTVDIDMDLQNPDLPITMIELDNAFYQTLVPEYGDLLWLSHSRHNLDKEDNTRSKLSYVLGNRLPTPNQNNTVYLVSLEHRYADNSPGAKPDTIGDKQRLVCLYKWEFFCKPGIMFNYTVTEKILREAKDLFPDIQLPEHLPDWVGMEFEGDKGKEELRDFLLNTYEITNVSQEARDFILDESKRRSKEEYKLTPGILKKAEKEPYNVKVPDACKEGRSFSASSDVRPAWVKHEFKGKPGKMALIKLLDGVDLITGIDKKAAAWILKKAKKAGGTFDGLLDAVEAGSFHERPRPGRPIKKQIARNLLASGRTVLRHHLRTGGKTYSWYKGPLSASREEDKGFSFPASSSDSLLIFNQATGMLDTSYAAAWNLGRLKGIENKGVSTSLFRWRHNQRQVLMKEQQELDHGHLHLVPPLSAELPEDVMRKITAWKLLKGIPFNYLVPKASLLPEESLRFFHLDTNWVRAFLDGFFSVGKVHGLDDKGEEYEHFPSFDKPITGLLLRSDAVAGWPSLHVDAHAERFEGTDVDIDPTHQIPILRKAFLNREVLFMLFDGIPKTIDIYLSPEALHSGFTPEIEKEETVTHYVHPICHPETGEDFQEGGDPVTITALPDEDGGEKKNLYRIFSPARVKAKMEQKINEQLQKQAAQATEFTLGPGRFGLELIEGTPMVRFQLEEVAQGLVMQAAATVQSKPLTEPAVATASVSQQETQEDDLTQISGIGESYGKALKKAGYKTIASIANATPKALKEALLKINSYYNRADTSDWPKQARALL